MEMKGLSLGPWHVNLDDQGAGVVADVFDPGGQRRACQRRGRAVRGRPVCRKIRVTAS